jgi:hypothetical protein
MRPRAATSPASADSVPASSVPASNGIMGHARRGAPHWRLPSPVERVATSFVMSVFS